MNIAIYNGMQLYELREIRRKLQDAYKKAASGKRVSAMNIGGEQTTLELTTLAQIRTELLRVNKAIAAHPEASAEEKGSRQGVRRFHVDFSSSTVC